MDMGSSRSYPAYDYTKYWKERPVKAAASNHCDLAGGQEAF